MVNVMDKALTLRRNWQNNTLENLKDESETWNTDKELTHVVMETNTLENLKMVRRHGQGTWTSANGKIKIQNYAVMLEKKVKLFVMKKYIINVF